jgi:hypothetical protein
VLPNLGDELGKPSVCNNLYQYGIPFINTTYHTYLIDRAEFHRDLDFFMHVCRVVKSHLDRRSLRRDQDLPGSGRDDRRSSGRFPGWIGGKRFFRGGETRHRARRSFVPMKKTM